jgi:FG-GAP-like repeat
MRGVRHVRSTALRLRDCCVALALTTTVMSSSALPLTFAPSIAVATNSWTNAIAIGDLDGDGRNDVVVANQAYNNPANDNKLMVFFQGADGALGASITLDGSTGRSVVVGDFNSDGRLDVATTSGSGIKWYAAGPGRTFTAAPAVGTANYVLIEAADLDGDGRTDLIGMEWSASQLHVHYQLAGGGFSAAVPVAATVNGWNDMKIADINGDGRNDVVFGSIQNSSGSQIGIVVQRSDGSFEAPHYPSHVFGPFAPWGVAVIDVNGDGSRDIVATQAWNTPEARLVVLFNQGGTFDKSIDITSYDIPETIRVADVDLDGLEDVVVLHGGWSRAGLYTRLPAGGLASEMLLPIPYASHYGPQGVAIGDINADGRPDIAIADYNSGIVILYNLTGACLSFADIDGTDPFCANVEWMRNRAVTLGCSAYSYCKGDQVSRTAMAAFMNRLGTALSPVARERLQTLSTPLPVTSSPIVCATMPYATTGFPRTVHLDGLFTATASADVDFSVWPVVSLDGGATWQQVGIVPGFGAAYAGRWVNARVNAHVDIDAGQTAQFALKITPALGSTGTLDQGTCNVRARVSNRNASVSPY